MLPVTPFQQLLLPRLGQAQRRLQQLVWEHDTRPLAVWQAKPSQTFRRLEAMKPRAFRRVNDYPHHWGQLFDHCWWKLCVDAVEKSDSRAKRQRYLCWRDEAEATAYLDGTPYFGFDPGHQYVPVSSYAFEMMVESVCSRTAIWVPGAKQGLDLTMGSRFDGAFLAYRNDDAWEALHDVQVLVELIALLEKPSYPAGADMWGVSGHRPDLVAAQPRLRGLIELLSRAMDVWDQEGLGPFRECLKKIFQLIPADADAIKATLTGHAHVDLVWLWPERVGEFKAVHSFANALRVLEQYPEVRFGYSQPASYEAVERYAPSLMPQVREQIARGVWEATGALYVESDVQLTCGEGLVRSIALGQQGFRALRGEDSRCVWLPDCFGFSGCLPSILKGFGLSYFFTTKMLWSLANRFPYSSFRWAGFDGSEVLAHFNWRGYNQTATPSDLHHAAMHHRQAAIHPDTLLPTGYGDGGGGVNASMCERARRMFDLAGLPRAQWGTIEGFFDRLGVSAADLPAWRGELYLEYHRGCYTTHSPLKAAFRAAERAMQVWEAVRCVTGGGAVDEAAWKRLCFAQFHDAIPGSSIPEVYQEIVPELQRLADTAMRHAADELASAKPKTKKPAACVFNPLPIERREVIGGRLYELKPLCGVEVAGLTPIDATPVKASRRRLSNGHVAAAFNASGEVTSLSVDGAEIALAEPAAQLWTFPDQPAMFDPWEIDRHTLSNGRRWKTKAEAQTDRNPGEGSVVFRRSLGDIGQVTIRYTLRLGDKALRIMVELELKKTQTLVKLVFPTKYHGREARFGAPFGSAKRPQWTGPLANDAMFEVPASRWACVSSDDEQEGCTLISESRYGFGALEGCLHVTLARSAKLSLPNVTSDTALISSGVPEAFADMGVHRIPLAFGSYRSTAPRVEQPAVLADTLFTEPVFYRGQPITAGLESIETSPSVAPSWAVPGDAGRWTLRLHETLGSRGYLRVRTTSQLSASLTDLRDQDVNPTIPGPWEIEPYSIVSVRISPNR